MVVLAVSAILAGWFWPIDKPGPGSPGNPPSDSAEPLLENWSPDDLTLVFSACGRSPLIWAGWSSDVVNRVG